IAGRRALSGLKTRRLGVRGVSDLLHANRVEGLALGAGIVLRGGGERRELRALTSYGFADHRAKGALAAVERGGRGALEVGVYREVRDVGDSPVIAPLVNSFSSQEFGRDYGDYYQAEGARVTYRHGVGVRGEWRATVGRESIGSLPVVAAPANGTFRPTPALGGPGVDLRQLGFGRRSEGLAVRPRLDWRVPVPCVALAVGPYARTPRTLTLAPFVAVGSTGRPVAGTPWAATPGPRATLGLGLEWLGVLRCDMGFGTATRRLAVALDVTRDFWGIL